MLDDNPVDASTPAETPAEAAPLDGPGATEDGTPAPRKAAARKKAPAKKSAAKKATPPPEASQDPVPTLADESGEPAPKTAKKASAKKAAAKSTTKKAAAKKTAAKKATTKTTTKKAAAKKAAPAEAGAAADADNEAAPTVGTVLFQAPEPTSTSTSAPARRSRKTAASSESAPSAEPVPVAGGAPDAEPAAVETDGEPTAEEGEGAATRRRRRRGGRRRRKPGEGGGETEAGEEAAGETAGQADQGDQGPQDETGEGSTRRRRRRRRTGEDGSGTSDDPQNTVTRVRQTRSAEDQITAVSGSTRLEAKKQRRREGREAGRRRAPIVSEAEFLARRESVDRVMVIRQHEELTQIAVLEDKVLVEHYVARESQTSLIGNVYLGRVQNVLPSMEAAFIDIGKGRNAVLYAGEVNWSSLGHKDGSPRKIESVLSSGQSVLVQVTKDPIGHKGARLTSQISLAGRFLVYVPDGTTSGISRKLPDTERNRLKTLLKEIVPDTAGVIVRTAAEGASEEELTRDVERLKARWEDIEAKAKGSAPQLLYGEPDLTLKVVRDLFTEDFARLVIEGPDAWDTVQGYVVHVAPDLEPRLERYETPASGADAFAAYRIDEQIAKGLDRKVWLPSGGSLVIDRTEAMTVVDVNTGKFTGSGGNLEETVTKNNLEAAEEIVRQLRLRDIGGIIVVDFIDMVLESNRDLVLRRLVECLGRDRTRHQVAEVTSLGLVQMTRKRIGTGLLEAFSHTCDACGGRGVLVQDVPVEPRRTDDDSRRGNRRTRSGRGRGADGNGNGNGGTPTRTSVPSPRDVAAVARPEAPVAGEAADVEVLVENAPASALETGPETGPERSPDPAPETAPQTSGETAPEPAGELVPEPADESVPEPAGESVPEPAGEAVEPVVEPVRVVTRTRRRSASRPAGPPAAGVIGEPPATGAVEPGTVAVEAGSPPPENPDAGALEPAGEDAHVEHVPIKKKGARKR